MDTVSLYMMDPLLSYFSRPGGQMDSYHILCHNSENVHSIAGTYIIISSIMISASGGWLLCSMGG